MSIRVSEPESATSAPALPKAPPRPASPPPAGEAPAGPPRREPKRTTPHTDWATELPVSTIVESPRATRRIGWILGLMLVSLPFALLFIPWRQTVSGDGEVVGFNPLDREFNVETPLYGRVMKYYVTEGTEVKQGDLIARVEHIDREFFEVLDTQIRLIADNKRFAQDSVSAYTVALAQTEAARKEKLNSAAADVAAAEQKVEAMNSKLTQSRAKAATLQFDANAMMNLSKEGIEPRQKAVAAMAYYQSALGEIEQVKADIKGVEADLASYRAKAKSIDAETQQYVEKAKADLQAAEQKLREVDGKLTDLESKKRQQMEAAEVRAPRDGTVLRLLTNIETEQVKPGDPIAVMIPDAPQLAVQLYLMGRDVPLVHEGDPVRLQFDGWPAVQFVGWPSVAVGTFSGKVALVDTTHTRGGKFRVLVVPDGEHDWPEKPYLRQGVRTNGWVLLRTVPLGFEIWRRMNGIPPALSEEDLKGKKSKGYDVDDAGYSDGASSDQGVKEDKDDKVKVKRPK